MSGDTRPESGTSLRWQLPRNTAEAATFYKYDPVVRAMVDSAVDCEDVFDSPTDLFETVDALRVPTEFVGLDLTDDDLLRCVELLDPGDTPSGPRRPRAGRGGRHE